MLCSVTQSDKTFPYFSKEQAASIPHGLLIYPDDEMAVSSELLVTIYHIVQCHITEDIIHFHDIFTLQLA
jgi:hypothetical protein